MFSCRIKAVLKAELYLNFQLTEPADHTINSKCKQVTDFSTSCSCGKEKTEYLLGKGEG